MIICKKKVFFTLLLFINEM